MTRKRSTWNKKADPYTMHQERDHTPAEDYLIGDPSAFGEGVHSDLPKDGELGRNEVGMPNMPASTFNHKDESAWNSDAPYDNADTFTSEDRDGVEKLDTPISEMNDRRVATRDVYAALERKANACGRIARALLPSAPDSLLEDQTYELMSLPDHFVLATLQRLAEDAVEDKEEDEAEDAKEASKKDEEAEKADEAKDEAKDEAEDEGDEDKEEDKEDKEASKTASPEVSDEEVEAMMSEISEELEDEDHLDTEAMMDEMLGAQEHVAATEFNIGLNPTMDVVASETVNADSDLSNLFNDTIPKEALPTAQARQAGGKSQGVSSLGGRVSVASSTGEGLDLAKLWKSDPDISGSF
jgi:hypothetical protein